MFILLTEGGTNDDGGEDPDRFLRLLGFGILFTVGGQALFNLMVATALIPTKGIALPLVSRGGTGWILTSLFLGLMISIDRTLSAPAPAQGGHSAPRGTDPGLLPRTVGQ